VRKGYLDPLLDGTVLFLAGFLVLSPISSLVASSLGAPHVPEVLAVPFLWFYRKSLRGALEAAMTPGKRALIALIFLGWWALLALGLPSSWRVIGTLSVARSYLWILAIALVARGMTHVAGRDVLFCSLGATVGSIVGGFMTRGLADTDLNLGNVASFFHSAYLTVTLADQVLVALVAPLLVYRIIQSSFRIVLIAGVFAGAVAVWSTVRRARGARAIRRAVMAIMTLVLASGLAYWYADAVGLTDTQHNRLVTRLEDREDEGDTYRLDMIARIPEDMVAHPIPEGFVAKGYAEGDLDAARRHGRVMDLPIYEFILTLGAPLALLLYAYLLLRGGQAWLRGMRGQLSDGDESLAMTFPMYVAMSWMSGAFLWHTYEAAFFGFALGRWWAITAPGKQSVPFAAGRNR
jgi:hypothetical protein